MARRLQTRIRRASPRRFYAAAALLSVYAIFVFALPSPWTKARLAANKKLPELIAGFPDGEPAASLVRLGEAREDYLWSQAFDLPFVALVAIAAGSAMAIALKRLALAKGDAQYVLLLPLLYVAFEAVENALLAAFAAGAPTAAPLVLIQQAATTGKIGALLLTALFGLAAVFAWAIETLGRKTRRRRA